MSQSDNWLHDSRDFLKSEGLISCLNGNNYFQDQQMTDTNMMDLFDELYENDEYRPLLTAEDEADDFQEFEDDGAGDDDADDDEEDDDDDFIDDLDDEDFDDDFDDDDDFGDVEDEDDDNEIVEEDDDNEAE